MARMAVRGTEEYALKLSRLGASTEAVAGKAIYAAADIVAGQIKRNLEGIPTVTEAENTKAYKTGGKSGLTKRQKQGLMESFGIAKMQNDNGVYNVKLGFDGYNLVKTRKYQKGQPNQLIARVTEGGSSYMDKQPFIRPAVNQTKKSAQAAMQAVIEEETSKLMG